MDWTEDIRQRLLAPFDSVKTREGRGGKQFAYLQAKQVEARLDEVVGCDGWSFDFDVIDAPTGKMVKGRLTVLGITKCDAGEANAEDELLKSAVSDAFKRSARRFGIGRYLGFLDAGGAVRGQDALAPALRAAGYTGAAAPVSDTRPAPKGRTPVVITAPTAPADDTRALGKMLMDLYSQVHGTGADREKMKADLAFLCEKTGDGPLTADQMRTGIEALQALIAEGDRAMTDVVLDGEATLVVPCTFPSCSVKMTPADAALSQKVHKSALCAKHSTMARAGMGG